MHTHTHTHTHTTHTIHTHTHNLQTDRNTEGLDSYMNQYSIRVLLDILSSDIEWHCLYIPGNTSRSSTDTSHEQVRVLVLNEIPIKYNSGYWVLLHSKMAADALLLLLRRCYFLVVAVLEYWREIWRSICLRKVSSFLFDSFDPMCVIGSLLIMHVFVCVSVCLCYCRLIDLLWKRSFKITKSCNCKIRQRFFYNANTLFTNMLWTLHAKQTLRYTTKYLGDLCFKHSSWLQMFKTNSHGAVLCVADRTGH